MSQIAGRLAAKRNRSKKVRVRTSQLKSSLRGGGGRELDNMCGTGSIIYIQAWLSWQPRE